MKKKDTVKLPKGQIDEMQPFESWSIEEQIHYDREHMHEKACKEANSRGGIIVLDTSIQERIKAKEEMALQEKIFAYNMLHTIQNEHPEVLKEFIEKHYGKDKES